MTTTALQGLALVAMVLGMPLLAIGTTSEIPAVTVSGAVIFTVGLVMLTAIRYIPTKEES